MTLRPASFVLLLVTLAFAVRLGAVLVLRDPHQGPHGISSADDVEFDMLARHVAEGEGYVNASGRPTSFRAPGWPFFLAGLYALAGSGPEWVYLANCALGAASCVLAYALGRQLLGEGPARVAGLLSALYLPHVWFATLFYSENLFVPLLALACWLLVRHLQTREDWPIALAGPVLGAMVLVRPFALLLVPIWGLVLLGSRGWRGLAAGLVLACGSALVVLPWTVRNYNVHGLPVLVATNGGSTFYGGNNERMVREWRLWGSWVSTTELPHRDLIDAAPTEVTHDQVEWDLGKRWVCGNPVPFLALEGLKLGRLFLWVPDFDAGPRWYYLVRAGAYLPLLPLLLVGAWRTAWRPAWPVVHGALLATVVTALIFWGSPRFRDTNAPLLMLYAAACFAPRARGPAPAEPARDERDLP